MWTILSSKIVHTRFSDKWLFVSFFYNCHYCFSLVFFYLVLLFIQWLYNEILNFSFCKYISSHPTSISSKLVLLPGALLFTLSISLNKFLLVEIPGMKHLTYLVIVDFTFETCTCACYEKNFRVKGLWKAYVGQMQFDFTYLAFISVGAGCYNFFWNLSFVLMIHLVAHMSHVFYT